jgi:hypothetical protein
MSADTDAIQVPLNPLSLPYTQRQMIVIEDDPVVRIERAQERSATSSTGVDWIKLAALTARALTGAGLIGIAVDAAIEAVKARNQFRQRGFNLLAIGTSEATGLVLPPGHPRAGVLYVGDPCVANVYHPAADFHRRVFESKFCEAIRLLMSLGATKLSVKHISGWSREFAAQLSVPISSTESGKASVGSKTSGQSASLFEAAFSNGVTAKIPDGLVWYTHEPMWRALAEGRLVYGLHDFTLNVRYEDDFGVNAGLKIAAGKAGLELGGKFADHVSTIWEISGTFKPAEEETVPRDREIRRGWDSSTS